MSVSVKKTGVVNVVAVTQETQTGSILTFNKPLILDNATVQIQGYQTGSGTPSPANVMPLVAYPTCITNSTGKNLISETRTISVAQGAQATNTIQTVYLKAGVTYTASCKQNNTLASQTRNTFVVHKGTNMIYGISNVTIQPLTFTPSESGEWNISIWTHTPSSDVSYSEYQLEVGETNTTYSPYLGETYNIALGQYVYEGTADISNRQLTISKAYAVLPTTGWAYANGVFYHEDIFPSGYSLVSDSNWKCNKYLCDTSASNTSGTSSRWSNYTIGNQNNSNYYRRILIKDTRFTDANNFMTDMVNTPIQLAYQLNTTVQLPTTNIALFGSNPTIWANAGNITVTAHTDSFNEINAVRASIAEGYINSTEFIEI